MTELIAIFADDPRPPMTNAERRRAEDDLDALLAREAAREQRRREYREYLATCDQLESTEDSWPV